MTGDHVQGFHTRDTRVSGQDTQALNQLLQALAAQLYLCGARIMPKLLAVSLRQLQGVGSKSAMVHCPGPCTGPYSRLALAWQAAVGMLSAEFELPQALSVSSPFHSP